MKLTPAQNGFIKGLAIVIVTAVVGYVSNEANLAPLVGNGLAFIIAGIVSSLESYVRSETGKGLLGAATVR